MLSRRGFLRDCVGLGIGLGFSLYGFDMLSPRELEAWDLYNKLVIVDLEKIELNFLKWNRSKKDFLLRYHYPVAIGSPEYPTPEADFKVHSIIYQPDWIVPKKNGEYMEWVKDYHRRIADQYEGVIPYEHPANLMGECKIRLKHYDTGKATDILIHGQGEKYIGQRVSHGCIRMCDSNILSLAKELRPDYPVFTRNGFRVHDDFSKTSI